MKIVQAVWGDFFFFTVLDKTIKKEIGHKPDLAISDEEIKKYVPLLRIRVW